MTVVLALLGMFIIPTTIFRSLAAGAILVTLAALAASMTLLPAMLALLGDRINWPRLSKRARLDSPADPKGGVWDRLARGVMASARGCSYRGRPGARLPGLVLLPAQQGQLADINQLPDVPSKKAFLTLQREFAGGLDGSGADRRHRRRAELAGAGGDPTLSGSRSRRTRCSPADAGDASAGRDARSR